MVTRLVKSTNMTTNLTNAYFISATFGTYFFSPFLSLMMKKFSYKYYSKRITTRENDNVQSRGQEESKLNSTINANSGAHTLTQD